MARKKKKKNQSKKKQQSEKVTQTLNEEARKNIISLILAMGVLVLILSLLGFAGAVGEEIDSQLSFFFGWARFVFLGLLILTVILYFRKKSTAQFILAFSGILLFFGVSLGLGDLFTPLKEMEELAREGEGTGYGGFWVASRVVEAMGRIAGLFILLGFLGVSLVLFFNTSLKTLWSSFRKKFLPALPEGGFLKSKKEKEEEVEEDEEDEDEEDWEEDGEGELESETVKKEDQDLSSEEPAKSEEEKREVSLTEQQKAELELKKLVKSIRFEDHPYESGEATTGDFEEKITIEDSFGNREEERSTGGEDAATPPRRFFRWQLPPLDLLVKGQAKKGRVSAKKNIDIITKTFKDFGIKVEPGSYSVGPTVTQYTFKPAVGVKISKILALQNDLALSLAAHPIRIEAPIPGKSLIGIEVPNQTKTIVHLRNMLESETFQKRNSDLTMILGQDVNGQSILASIEKMPHLMIAGSTGTGKSVGINSLIITLLYQNSPRDLKMILVDPKRVELSMYNDIPHLLTPVIVDTAKVVNALKWAVGEMDRRYKLLQKAKTRNIESYNQKAASGELADLGEEFQEAEKMPFIIIVIDELADLMASHGKEVEVLIVRLAQMARAVGIHLVVSTQRPSVEVITGLIKANITARVAFQVATQIDSRTILDMRGAEKLLGGGDLLYLGPDSSQPIRVQGAFISEDEVKKVVDFIKQQAEGLSLDEEEDLADSLVQQLETPMASSLGGLTGDEGEGGDEELYQQAKEIVIKSKKASTSMLQRHLKVGYARAARIVDMLEEHGVVGPADGPKGREVLLKAESESEAPSYDDPEADQAKRENWS